MQKNRFAKLAFAAVFATMTTGALADHESGRAHENQPQQQSQQNLSQRQSDRTTTGEPGQESMLYKHTPDQKFITDAASSNRFEVEISKVALQRVQDDQVKQFAQHLIDDHSQAEQQLMQVAQGMGMKVPQKLDPVHQAKLDHMEHMQGKEFERHYVFGQVADHHKEVLEFGYQAANAEDHKVKQLASQMLPKLQQHLQMAERLAGETEARTASQRYGPDNDASGLNRPSGDQINRDVNHGINQDLNNRDRDLNRAADRDLRDVNRDLNRNNNTNRNQNADPRQ